MLNAREEIEFHCLTRHSSELVLVLLAATFVAVVTTLCLVAGWLPPTAYGLIFAADAVLTAVTSWRLNRVQKRIEALSDLIG